ncbi:MAG: division/cell wall cluster transcriptional repressor MraZ [Clostridia bacterium]|nr:division/cell wall cluster transcriptional repressor MraZ [Clostridia bacterium]
MLVGTHRNTVDSKFRTIVPASFREELGGKLMLTLNIDNPKCIRAYTYDKYQELLKNLLEAKRSGNVDTRGIERCFVDAAKCIELDAQYRMVLPPELRQKAGITKDICTVGKIEFIEIWDSNTYDELENSFDHANSIEVARSLGML